MHLYINGIHIMSVSNAELNIGNNDIPLIIGTSTKGSRSMPWTQYLMTYTFMDVLWIMNKS